MGFIKQVIPALCAAGAVSLATAQINNVDSIATCSLQLSAGGSADSLSATAIAAASATADLLCNGTLVEDTVDALASAEAIAFAAAEAVALVSVDCYNSGNSAFTVDGLSIAQARAEAYASAYVMATASAAVCSPNFNCTAVASFVGSAFQAIFAEAVAIAEVTLDQNSPNTTVIEFAAAVANVTAEVWAVAVASASASVEDGCDLEIIGLGVAGNSGVFCAAEVATEDNSTAIDAVAEVVTEAIAVSGCNETFSNVTVETGEALASAIASVIAEVSASCDTVGSGSLCVTGEANLTAIVEATAEAFAFVFVEAINTCEDTFCETSASVLTEAITNIAATAAAGILVMECIDGGGSIDIDAVVSDFVANTSLALASVIANATVTEDGQCLIDVNITAATVIVLPEVVPPNDTMMMMNNTMMMMNDTMMMNGTMMMNDTMPMMNDTMTMNDTMPMMNDTMNGTMPMMNGTMPMMNDTMNGTTPMMNGTMPMMNGTMPMMNGTMPMMNGTMMGGFVCEDPDDCVRNNRQCAGEGFPVARPCCSSTFFCVRRNNGFAQCRLNGEPGITNWEGSILPCGVPSDIPAADIPVP